ncbi:MAG: YncE family protein [Phycisphaeraceae bacterium]|nr:YncE family protein [Phycisphaeraceae bacterium]
MCENKKSEKTATTGVSPLMLWAVLILWVCLGSPVLGQHYAYVSNMGIPGDPNNDDLSIVDLSTNTVVATVPVGDVPQGVAINPAGTAVYVANTVSGDFTVIDTVTHISTTLPAGLFPVGVAIHPNGRHIYLTKNDFFDGGVNSTVSVIDRATNTIVDEISCGNNSIGVAVHPDGTKAYVSNIGDGTVAVFDTETHEVLGRITLEPVGPDEVCAPVPLVVHPQGTYVYVANRKGPTVWAINTATHEFIARAFGHAHVGISINPEGTRLYVPDFDDTDPNLPPQGATVAVLDAHTLEGITTIDGLSGPLDVAVHPDGKRLYITNVMSNTLSVVDAATNSIIENIPVGILPNAFGECVGPGVPRLLNADAMARLEAVKATIEGGADGVVSPGLALEQIDKALTAGHVGLQAALWSTSASGETDPRRLDASQGCIVFGAGEDTVKAILNAVRNGWIINTELRSELLAISDAVVRAHRVLAAVAIDDAIVGAKPTETIEQAQALLENGNALVKEAKVWDQMDKKAMLLTHAISEYQHAWQAALD